ncbi:MAG TPA: S8 family serine peptidase [Candidatus Sulfotelmatobacter sp.]|nr:S8 family serine peptidase [Candidatus Sulfotelmatobacter sp.]
MKQRNLILFLLCVVAICGCQPDSMCSEALDVPPLKTVSDVAVTTNSSGVATVYVADKNGGAIYSAEFAANSVVRFGDFHPIFASPKYSRPIAIAYNNGNLFICDAVAGVFSLDLTSRAIQPILGNFEVKQPGSIAVLNGQLAISDKGRNGVFLVSLDGRTTSFKEIPAARSLGRVAIYDQQVAVLDEETFTLWGITTLSGFDSGTYSQRELRLLRRDPGLRDFRIADGVFYLAYDDHLSAVEKARLDADPLLLLSDAEAFDLHDALAIDHEQIFLVRSRASQIERVPQQVPIKLSLNSQAEASNRALIELYTYLYSNHILPVRPVSATPSQKVSSLLLAEKVIVPPFSSISEQSLGSLQKLLCAINGSVCQVDALRSAQPMRHGSLKRIPYIGLKPILSTSEKTFTGQSFRDYVDESISPELSQSAMAKFGSLEKIADLSPNSLDEYFKSQGFTSLNIPNADLQPGRLLVSPNHPVADPFAIVSSLDCAGLKDYSVSSEPIKIPNPSISHGALLGRALDSHETVVTTVIRAEQAVVETLRVDQVDKFLKGGACDLLSGYGHARIVVQSIKVLGLRYRFQNENGKLLQPDFTLLAAMGVPGHPDPAGDWSLIVDAPIYLAYRAIDPSNSSSLHSTASKADDASPLYGKYVVPSQIWESRVMVFERDLADPNSALMKVHNPSHGVYVLRTPPTAAMASSVDNAGAPMVDSAGFQTASRDRASLYASIHYDPALVPDNVSSSYVAIAENAQSIDPQHVAFWDAGNTSSWWTLGEASTGLVQVARAASPPTTSEIIRPFSEAQDHGSHVAGILGTRAGKLGLGLIPKAPLVILDTSDLSNASDLISRALTANVRIFNFSFEQAMAPTDPIYESLKQRIIDANFALFIVAAGNEGVKLSSGLVPIGFGEDQPNNVIGVAAADGLHKLDQWFDDSERIKIGTNFGSRYVQLLAPGKSIYSVGHDNGYTRATGSSQAVPQVTAAAAVLYALGHKEPWRIKQRLMYTADWLENFRPYAWGGGLLNFRRAVWQADKNLWKGQSFPDEIYSFDISGTPPVRISASAMFDQPEGVNDGPVPPLLFFTNILRISTQADKKLRITYLDSNEHLKIIKDATLSGVIKCSSYQRWDSSLKHFQPADPDLCATDGVRAEQVFDYVASMP